MVLKQLMRPDNKDEWGIKELQNCILNIAKYIHDFCEENHIQYCLMGGTALGAVRHGGFIPWDDDIDLFMTPEEYVKFRDAFNEKGDKENYYLQELGKSNGKVGFAKVRLNNSYYEEEMCADWDMHHGVFVDIMIQYYYPKNKLSQKWMLFWQRYLAIKAAANMGYVRRGKLVSLALLPFKLLPKRFLLGYAINQMWKYKSKDSNSYFHFYMRYSLPCCIYPKEIFEEYVLTDFETVKFYVPKGVHEYLTIVYGDYLKLPNMEKIKWNQHAIKWSVDTPAPKHGKGIFDDEKYYWK